MLTPAEVRAATRKWLARPAFALTVEPGTRTEGGEARGGFIAAPDGDASRPAFFRDPLFAAQGAAAAGASAGPDRSKLPPVGELASRSISRTIERATLSNGMQVYFARRGAVPVVSVRVAFDAGYRRRSQAGARHPVAAAQADERGHRKARFGRTGP